MDTSAPIGVFDSGMGGLTVLQAIRKVLPQERLLYIADSVHAPYGDKSLEYIQQRALTLTRFLLEHGTKALVIASNTTTVAAADLLRSTFPVPIVAVEPALKLAVASTKTGVIGVLVTVVTSQSTRFAALLERFRQDVKVIIQPAPGLVEQIEIGDLASPTTRALAARQREQTEEFKELYAERAGIEGIHAQAVRRMGLRRSRYIGEPRTHLQHVITAAALNVCQLYDWQAGISPHLTPLSHFARFMKEIA